MSTAITENLLKELGCDTMPLSLMPFKDKNPITEQSASVIRNLYDRAYYLLDENPFPLDRLDIACRGKVQFMVEAQVPPNQQAKLHETPIKISWRLTPAHDLKDPRYAYERVWRHELADLVVRGEKGEDVSQTTVMGREFGQHPNMNFMGSLAIVGEVLGFFEETEAARKAMNPEEKERG